MRCVPAASYLVVGINNAVPLLNPRGFVDIPGPERSSVPPPSAPTNFGRRKMVYVKFDDSDNEMDVDIGDGAPHGMDVGGAGATRYRSTYKFRVADPQPGSVGVVSRLATR